MDRDLARLAAAAALALLAAAPAFARDFVPIHVGEKSFGELDANGQVTVTLDAPAGTSLDLTCVTWRGDDLVPDITLTAPDGAAVDLAGRLVASKGGKAVRVKGLVLAAGGSYRITVAAHIGTHGGFDLATKGKRLTKFSGKADSGARTLALSGVAGDVATLTMKAKKAELSVVRLVGPAGAETAIGTSPPATQTLAATGAFAFDVTSSAAFSWSVKLKPAKLRHEFLDADAIEGRGTISGTVHLDGVEETAATSAGPAKSGRASRPGIEPGDVIVSYLPGKAPPDPTQTVRDVLGGGACEIVHALSATGPWLVRVPYLAGPRGDARRAGRTRAIVRGAGRASGVKWTATNDLVEPSFTPNDTLFPYQEHLAQIRMPAAWDVLIAQKIDGGSVTIAVVDTGINPHADLSGVWLPGYDFVTYPFDGDGWDADPTETGASHHATLVSGVIGALSGNSAGVAGCIPRARIVPVRVLPGGAGTNFDVVSGMRWSAGLDVPGAPPNPTPARVVNCSLGGPVNPLYVDTCAAILAKGVLIVASAGNSATSAPQDPAIEPGVIAVGALGSNLSRASYSNFGPWVTIWAPGTTLTTTVNGTGQQTYEYHDGTSFSAPQVSAVAALVLAVNPALGPAEVTSILTLNAAPLSGGMRLLDAAATLQVAASTLPPSPIPSALPAKVEAGRGATSAKLFLRNLGTGTIVLSSAPAVVTGDGGNWLGVSTAAPLPAFLPLEFDVAFLQDGLGDGVFRATITFETNHGTVAVPVRLVRSPPPKLGFVRIRALRPNGTQAATAVTSAAAGWRYRLDDVPDGEYVLTAEMDADGSLKIERADEWSGGWPLAGAPERFVLEHGQERDAIDIPIRRLDASFVRSGVGGGAIHGALAVRAVDAITREPVPGAEIFVGDGIDTAVTDARGRAVVVGEFAGGQVVTVLAQGYSASTHVGANAQFQTFLLQPVVRPETEVTVTVDGLAASDASVEVALGDAWTSVVHAGGGSVVAKFTATQRRVPTPVAAVARDAAGVPTRSGFAALDATLGRDTAEIAVTAATVAAPAASYQVLVSWPDAAMQAAAAATTADVTAIWSADGFPRVGGGANPDAGLITVRWAVPAELDPLLVAVMRFSVTDASGRRSGSAFRGRLGTLTGSPEVVLPAPPVANSPADGASVDAAAIELLFDPLAQGQFQWITLTDTATGDVWEIETRGINDGIAGLRLPAIPGHLLPTGHTFRWSVRGAYAPGIIPDEYSDEGRAVGTTDTGESAPRTFTTK